MNPMVASRPRQGNAQELTRQRLPGLTMHPWRSAFHRCDVDPPMQPVTPRPERQGFDLLVRTRAELHDTADHRRLLGCAGAWQPDPTGDTPVSTTRQLNRNDRCQGGGNGFAAGSLRHHRRRGLHEAISSRPPPNETRLLSTLRPGNAPITRLVFERQTCPWTAPIDRQRSTRSQGLSHSPGPSRTSCLSFYEPACPWDRPTSQR